MCKKSLLGSFWGRPVLKWNKKGIRASYKPKNLLNCCLWITKRGASLGDVELHPSSDAMLLQITATAVPEHSELVQK